MDSELPHCEICCKPIWSGSRCKEHIEVTTPLSVRSPAPIQAKEQPIAGDDVEREIANVLSLNLCSLVAHTNEGNGLKAVQFVAKRIAAALSAMNVDGMREALAGLVASCTRTAPALHDDCGTRVITAPTIEALRQARTALETPAKGEGE